MDLERLAELLPSCPPQLANPDSVEGLVLINIDIQARGWIDWAAQKVRLSSSSRSIWTLPPPLTPPPLALPCAAQLSDVLPDGTDPDAPFQSGTCSGDNMNITGRGPRGCKNVDFPAGGDVGKHRSSTVSQRPHFQSPQPVQHRAPVENLQQVTLLQIRR